MNRVYAFFILVHRMFIAFQSFICISIYQMLQQKRTHYLEFVHLLVITYNLYISYKVTFYLVHYFYL